MTRTTGAICRSGFITVVVTALILMIPIIAGATDTDPSPSPPAADGAPSEPRNWGQERGVTFGLYFQRDRLAVADDPGDGSFQIDARGGGVVLAVGYTFTPTLTLRLTVGTAQHLTNRENVEAVHPTFLVEAHRRFSAQARFRPYLQGGLGVTGIRLEAGGFDAEALGFTATFGGGFLFSLSHTLALDAGLRLELINWDSVTVRQQVGDSVMELSSPVDEDGAVSTFVLGLLIEL